MADFLVKEHTLSREIHAGRAPFARMFFTLIPDPATYGAGGTAFDENFGGADNDDEVALTDLLTWIRANAATFVLGDGNAAANIPNRTLTFKEVERIKKVSDRLWQATALYTLKEDFATEFDTTGATARIVLSEKTERRYPYQGGDGHGGSGSASLAPDFKQLINVQDDGIEGTDIVVPKFDWIETHILPITTVTPAYRLLLSTLTGSVNDELWRNGSPAGFTGFQRGEVLFLGATGRLVGGQDYWELSYKFSYQKNLTGGSGGNDQSQMVYAPSIGGSSSGYIKKVGWEYLWFNSIEREFVGETPSGGPTNGQPVRALIRQPTYGFVEQVYPYIPFTLLGIPNPI